MQRILNGLLVLVVLAIVSGSSSPKEKRALRLHEIGAIVACSEQKYAERFNALNEDLGIPADPSRVELFTYYYTIAFAIQINSEAGKNVCKELHAKIKNVTEVSTRPARPGTGLLSVYKVEIVSVFDSVLRSWVPKSLILYIPARWDGDVI